jgi:hypothetical protein
LEKEKYISELNDVFTQAKASENWAVALRAGEMIAKSKGWLASKNQEVMSITDYPLEVLVRWHDELQVLMEANQLLTSDHHKLPHYKFGDQKVADKLAHHKKVFVRGKRGDN